MIGRLRGGGQGNIRACRRESFTIFVIICLLISVPARNVCACVDGSRLHDVWARKQGSVPTTEGVWGRPFPSLEVEVGMRDQVGLVGMTT